MSYQYVQQGNPLQLELQLPDGNTSMFPAAVVRDASNTPVVGSPFAMTSAGDGLYTNSAYVPANGTYRCTYIVYSDAGRTTEALQYGRSSDHFQVDQLVSQSNTNTTNIAAIKTITDQITFDAGNVNAKANVVADKTGYGLSTTALDSVADYVWDEPIAGHLAIGSTGHQLNDAATSSDPTAIAMSVWNAARASYSVVGSFGEANQGVLSTLRASRIDNLDATISSRASQLSVDTNQTDLENLIAALSAQISALATPADIADQVWDTVRASHATVGTFGESNQGVITTGRAAALDNLDVAVSTRQSSATALSQFNTLHQDALDTQALIIGLPTPATPAEITQAVWDAVRASHATAGTFGEALQGVLSTTRAGYLDNLTRLDVVVSTRSSQTSVDAVQTDVTTLLSRLTATRANNLDYLNASITSRASQSSVNLLPQLASIVSGVWDAPNGSYLVPGSTGANLASAASGVVNPSAVASAVWEELKSAHTTPGTFGALLDVAISSRASDADMQLIKGTGFATGTDSLHQLRLKLNSLPTSAGDATLANQNTIIATLANKANQNTLLSVQSAVAAIPLNPLLTTDPRLNNLDAQVSTRATQAQINNIAGAGFNTLTDSLVEIRAAISASVDLTPVLNQLSLIQGAGFSTVTDSLVALKTQGVATQASADAAQTAALAAQTAAQAAASQPSVDAIALAVAAIPTNPALASDPRFNNLDALISSRATQTSVNAIQGTGFSSGTDSLAALRVLIQNKPAGDATLANQNTILSQLSTKASQATLLSTLGAVQAIPLNPLLDDDPRLDFIDVPLTTLADKNDITEIKGAGYNVNTDSLYAISQSLAGANLDLTPVLNQLTIIKGAGFLPVNDNLHNIQTTAEQERAQIYANTQACLSNPEPI